MDDGWEGMSWLGNIVKKIDDLVLEVDNAVQQEFVSVTNQLQTAVKFCQDLVEGERPLLSLENTEKEPATEIDVKESDASKNEGHCEKESWNGNHLHCTSSVEHMDVIQSDRCVDPQDYQKSEVIDNENLVKEKLFQHEMSVVVSLKEEESNNLEEDKQLKHEMTDIVSPKEKEINNIEGVSWTDVVSPKEREINNIEGVSCTDVVSPKEKEINNVEDVSSYISSASPSPSYSDYSFKSCEILVPDVEVTPADASTESPDDCITEGISHNGECRIQYQMFEEVIGEYLKAKVMPISRRQQAHISYLRRVQPHYSMMKTITENLDGILQEEDNIGSSMITIQEHDKSFDSDWVIV